MAEDLLAHYNRELRYLRELGREFADAHPDVAAHLRPSAESAEDPHVSRLVEGTAFVAARIHKKLDDELPELVESLLGVLQPHYTAPIPSFAILAATPGATVDVEQELPAGAEVETEALRAADLGRDVRCRFRTTQALQLVPLTVARAATSDQPFEFEGGEAIAGAQVAIRVDFACSAPGGTLAALAPRRLRLYLGGQLGDALRLYEALGNDLLEVASVVPAAALEAGEGGPRVRRLGRGAVRFVGFGRDEELLPYPAQAHPGYRLLSDYFAFPQKFLFVDVDLGPEDAFAGAGDRFELVFYLRRGDAALRQAVTPSAFALGCAPVVNLHQRRAEPILLDGASADHHVDPNARSRSLEVWRVDAVDVSSPQGVRHRLHPLFGTSHFAVEGGPLDEGRRAGFWVASRRAADEALAGAAGGSEVYLSFVDLDGAPVELERWVAEPLVTCLDRDLPTRLPFGDGRPRLQLAAGGASVASLRLVTAPTPTRRPYLETANLWRLVSHLSLEHLSLAGPDGAAALREILGLYSGRGAADALGPVAAIADLRVSECWRPVASPVGGSLARGSAVALELDPARFEGRSPFLFATVLERFLALWSHVNSFVEVAVRLRGREGIWCRWTPRSGAKPIL